MNKLFMVCFLGVISTLHCQENYPLSDVNLKMLINANAIVREHQTRIEIKDIDDVEISTFRVVTVLNESGESFIDAYQNYDKSLDILDQEAIIYNSKGEEIKKFKKRDFSSRSNFQNFVLFSDNKVSFLTYTPREYPYTVKYTSKIRTLNSLFLPDWRPLEGYKVSVQKSSYQLINEANIPIRYSERNLDSLKIIRRNSEYELSYSVEDIMAKSYEEFSPSFNKMAPGVLVALEKFSLEGITGESHNWKDFGKWQYENLVAGQGDLSDVIVRKISDLTKDAETDEEKARIIYKYVQDNSRYIAVNLGIGGLKPYKAEEVDRLGYGDCKGLTNYTRALLKSQGIDSDYTVIYGGPKRDIDPGFTKMQGNHVILSIPRENDDDIWLECTSQDAPFNYLGDFTDDRFALKVKPTGGEIVRTKKYSEEENLQSINAIIEINPEGGFKAKLERASYGVPYGDIYLLELQTEDVKENFYRENWSEFENIAFEEISFNNDKYQIEFKESLKFQADRFCSFAGDRLLIPLNFIDDFHFKVDKDEQRKNNIKIVRGFTFKDSFTYKIPSGYSIEAIPEGLELKSDFGEVSLNISVLNDNENIQIIVDRYLKLSEGEWAPEKFEKFRNFINQIHQLSNQKAVIMPNSKT